jgi:hypothetical protein
MLELIGWFVFGFLMYQLIAAWIAMQQIKHIVRDVIEKNEKSNSTTRSISIRFESVVQGEYSVVLVYNVETNQFLGQAETLPEAKDMLIQKYPDTSFTIATDNIKTSNIQTIDTKAV